MNHFWWWFPNEVSPQAQTEAQILVNKNTRAIHEYLPEYSFQTIKLLKHSLSLIVGSTNMLACGQLMSLMVIYVSKGSKMSNNIYKKQTLNYQHYRQSKLWHMKYSITDEKALTEIIIDHIFTVEVAPKAKGREVRKADVLSYNPSVSSELYLKVFKYQKNHEDWKPNKESQPN